MNENIKLTNTMSEKALRNLYSYFKTYILPIKDKRELIREQIIYGLVYSAIGGRTCYSKDVVEEIKNKDKRLSSDIIDYLYRISKLHHFSIFAHTYIELPIKNIDILFSLYNLEKSYYDNENGILLITLRHLIEAYYISNDFNDGIGNLLNDLNISYLTGVETINIKEYKQITVYDTDVLYFPIKNNVLYKHDYELFILKNIPRYISHQIVRHTSLNFSQQSQRYVKFKFNSNDNILIGLTNAYIDDYVFNKLNKNNVNYDDLKVLNSYIKYNMSNVIKKSQIVYDDFVNNKKIPSEIARAILTEQTPTILTLSSTMENINSFISKRLDNHAQFEIKQIAKTMVDLIYK